MKQIIAALTLPLILSTADGAAFTYQGRLTDNAVAANGIYDLRFRLALDALGNNYFQDSVVTNGLNVTEGVFTVTLDFDSSVFANSNLWLQVDVRTNGAVSDYTVLTPLQALTPAPYALMAASAGN